MRISCAIWVPKPWGRHKYDCWPTLKRLVVLNFHPVTHRLFWKKYYFVTWISPELYMVLEKSFQVIVFYWATTNCLEIQMELKIENIKFKWWTCKENRYHFLLTLINVLILDPKLLGYLPFFKITSPKNVQVIFLSFHHATSLQFPIHGCMTDLSLYWFRLSSMDVT